MLRGRSTARSVSLVCTFAFWLSSSTVCAREWTTWFNRFINVAEPGVYEPLPMSSPSQGLQQSQAAHGSDTAEWLTPAAYVDYAYRNTNFYKSGHNTVLLQGDSRLEFWMPPGRREFSWGPYVRFAGLTSDHSQAWENAWLAQPGFGIHAFPFSFPQYREKESTIGQMLGPLRLFAEYNRMDYWGSENIWRPNEQVRVGVDYWKAMHVNNTFTPWWVEIWSGLFWQSANEFDKDYDTPILGNALRFGIRRPNAGVLSTFSPYILAESSLTDNEEYYWENRLAGGAGIRFAPLLYEKKDESNWLTRFVVFAEYVGAVAYYRDSAPSSVPDYDFRVGISVSTGEWYR